MNNITRNKTLVFIIVLLLLTNIGLLFYFLSGKKHHPEKGRESFTNALKKEVGFSDAQIEQFNTQKKNNWAKAKADMDQIRNIKLALFDLVKKPEVSDSVVDQLTDSIANLQKRVEVNAFHHFRATRSICTPEQQAKYDSFMTKIIRQGRDRKSPPPAGK